MNMATKMIIGPSGGLQAATSNRSVSPAKPAALSEAKLEALLQADAIANSAGLAPYSEVLALLRQSVNYIEHFHSNKGQCTTDAQWDQNVAEFRRLGVSQLGIGRSYTDKASVELGSCREALQKAGFPAPGVPTRVGDLPPAVAKALHRPEMA